MDVSDVLDCYPCPLFVKGVMRKCVESKKTVITCCTLFHYSEPCSAFLSLSLLGRRCERSKFLDQ